MILRHGQTEPKDITKPLVTKGPGWAEALFADGVEIPKTEIAGRASRLARVRAQGHTSMGHVASDRNTDGTFRYIAVAGLALLSQYGHHAGSVTIVDLKTQKAFAVLHGTSVEQAVNLIMHLEQHQNLRRLFGVMET